jgi:hypothetical protein
MMTKDTWFDRFFRDKDGNIVIAQMPNLPISIWAIASLFRLIFTTGKINLGLDLVATTSLLIWSLLELFQGVNYFRRSLGFIVIVSLLVPKIS